MTAEAAADVGAETEVAIAADVEEEGATVSASALEDTALTAAAAAAAAVASFVSLPYILGCPSVSAMRLCFLHR